MLEVVDVSLTKHILNMRKVERPFSAVHTVGTCLFNLRLPSGVLSHVGLEFSTSVSVLALLDQKTPKEPSPEPTNPKQKLQNATP